MTDRQRIISIYVSNEEFSDGSLDITEKVYQHIPKEEVEVIKYMMPSSTEKGIYYTVVLLTKEVKEKGTLGFAG
ncbi:hypothetical protein [Pontibacter sp. G13]|uniref:hypothetical protein n=1 Tax=Pontibacter sp. G13 TaxID=3074898 RepID=UPI002889BFC2|nr:hypothetical protein [Pontibacter sp. G13]WNJ20724.1 hypothetical protein RJD25_09600 [Pontibacter sp. G13]